MRYYVEESLRHFKFWSGGERANDLSDEMLDRIEQELEMIEPEDGWSDTAINDYFWHEPDSIAQLVGYKDWEHLEEDISDEDVNDADEWFEEFVDNKDWVAIDDLAYAGDINMCYETDEVSKELLGCENKEDLKEWCDYQNEEASREWWDSLSDIRKVKLYRDNC